MLRLPALARLLARRRRVLALGLSVPLGQRDRGGQIPGGLGRVGGAGQGRAHQEGVHQAGQAPYVVGCADPRLADEDHPGRGQRGHLLGARQVRLQGA